MAALEDAAGRQQDLGKRWHRESPNLDILAHLEEEIASLDKVCWRARRWTSGIAAQARELGEVAGGCSSTCR